MKKIWLNCQRYFDEEEADEFTKTAFDNRKAETRESAEVPFIGRVASDFFSCDKHLTLICTSLRC